MQIPFPYFHSTSAFSTCPLIAIAATHVATLYYSALCTHLYHNALTHQPNPQHRPPSVLRIILVLYFPSERCQQLASFPGHSHCQYLIVCSMKIQWGKAWEIWSRGMTSHGGGGGGGGRGALPNHYNTYFALIRPRTVVIVCLANALTSSPWMDSTRKGIEILHWASPPRPP